jgi:hypothetical protein
VDPRVSIRAHFERFPASIKGAFVLRAADGDPHQVRLEAARVAECAGRAVLAIELEPVILDVAPTLDVFVPFEVPTLDLAAGWYRLECDATIDGTPVAVQPGDRFLVPWPRAAVRRGTRSIGAKVGDVALGDLECAADQLRITYEAEEAPRVKLTVDGAVHPVLEIEHDDERRSGRIIGYPVPRDHERLAIQVRGADPVEVALP